MADFAVRFNDFTGGDWGDEDPAKVKANQFKGTNVVVYGSGLLGPRAGWKLLDLTGKVAGGNPPNYTGLTRGFDLMRDHLTLVLDTKSYDIYWDLSLAPGGSLPATAPATLPAGITAAPQAFAQLLFSNDGAGVKEWLLSNGVLTLKSAGATPTWQVLSTVGGATAPPALSVLARWGLYLIGVDQGVPWRIRFTQVDQNGPNFLVWPAANYLDMSTTDAITTVKGIFNLLYLGKASGWFAVSGVLGVLASVRELAYGNGPIDNRAASVTTDNRVVYWPLQKTPAFWNGERVQLVDGQRMDPRTTWIDATPVTARTMPKTNASQGIGLPDTVRVTGKGVNELNLATLLRQNIPNWAASGAHAGTDTLTSQRTTGLPRGTSIPFPPGVWTPLKFSNQQSGTGAWTTSPDGLTYTATVAGTYTLEARVIFGIPQSHCALAVFRNGVELARAATNDPNVRKYNVVARAQIAVGDTVQIQFLNSSPTDTITTSVETIGQGAISPIAWFNTVPPVAAGARWVCPVAGNYDIHVEMMGYDVEWFFLLLNGNPIAGDVLPSVTGTTVAIDVANRALALNDELSVGVLVGRDDTRTSVAIGQRDGYEGTAEPYLRITNRATQQQVGTLGMFGDSVVVTPTEKRLLMAGDDGATTKVWAYGDGVWTHHEFGVLIAGMAPADVRMSYLLPEHVIFATKRSYTAEALKVWSINHDIDRPAFVSDQWASPYDQAMQTGDVLVKGEVSLPMWFDGQGRQCRVRSVIVQFVKWDQGIRTGFVTDGTNRINARVDAVGPYDRGVTPGVEATWSEPMALSANTLNGTEDSWRFNVGEQGFGNGFQVVFTALYGVAIREVVVTVDVRTERT